MNLILTVLNKLKQDMQCFFSWRQKRDLPPPWRSLQHADQNLGVVRFALWTMALCLVGVPLSARTLQIWKMALCLVVVPLSARTLQLWKAQPLSLGGGSAVSENASTVERALVPGGGSAVSENALEMEEAMPSGARTVNAKAPPLKPKLSFWEAFPHHCLKVDDESR